MSNSKQLLYLHAAGACIAWAVLMPIGSALRKMTSKTRWHALVMSAAVILVVLAFSAGIVISLRYPKHSHFTSAHQVIGLVLFPLIIIQAFGGAFNHLIFKKTGKPTWLGVIHKYLGPSLITVGVLNGYIGIEWAGDDEYVLPYIVTVVVWLYVLFTFTVIVRRVQRRRLLKVSQQGFPPHVHPVDDLSSSDIEAKPEDI